MWCRCSRHPKLALALQTPPCFHSPSFPQLAQALPGSRIAAQRPGTPLASSALRAAGALRAMATLHRALSGSAASTRGERAQTAAPRLGSMHHRAARRLSAAPGGRGRQRAARALLVRAIQLTDEEERALFSEQDVPSLPSKPGYRPYALVRAGVRAGCWPASWGGWGGSASAREGVGRVRGRGRGLLRGVARAPLTPWRRGAANPCPPPRQDTVDFLVAEREDGRLDLRDIYWSPAGEGAWVRPEGGAEAGELPAEPRAYHELPWFSEFLGNAFQSKAKQQWVRRAQARRQRVACCARAAPRPARLVPTCHARAALAARPSSTFACT